MKLNVFNGTIVTWTVQLSGPHIAERMYECVVVGQREVRIKLRGRQRRFYPEGQKGRLDIHWWGNEIESLFCTIKESKDCGILDCSQDSEVIFVIDDETTRLG